eukprot:TRINITY_DN1603_c0_g2_i2.p1 TRINITY_DN1603_c0_g2~~TRINITY_DN1603_c0_g2_i2.p1  ORF type:complete len:896 (-),score=157.89 TRINITY_DN1603_c0_g2_i2:169-2856(-)
MSSSTFLKSSFSFINQADVRKVYDLKQELGRGTFSVVRLGIHKKTGKKYAVKIINKKTATASVRNMLDTEIRILEKVRHPNIIGLESIFEVKTHLFLVMEYVEGGELFDRIVEKGSFSEVDAATTITQILSAVKYLHDNGIVHRDLKPENVLCATKDGLEVKIADFGLSKIMRNEKLQTCCGTPNYAAPELLACEGYGETVDMWSVGVMLYVLLSGCLPFFGDTHNELFKRIMEGTFYFPTAQWGHISDAAKSLVAGLLTVDPRRRMTADSALRHPWLSAASSRASIPGLRERMSRFNTIRHTDSLKYVVPGPATPPNQGAGAAMNIYDNKDDSSSTSSSGDEDDENSDSEYEQHSDDESSEEDGKSTKSTNAAMPIITTTTSTKSVPPFDRRKSSKKLLVPESLTARAGSQRWEDKTDWAKLASIAKIIKCTKDQVILKEGHQNRNFFRIKTGSVRVYKKRPSTSTLLPSSSLGSASLGLSPIASSASPQLDDDLQSLPERKQVLLHTMTMGTMFGEISMLQPSGIVTATIVAEEGAELFEVTASDMNKFFETDLDLAERFYRELAVIQAQRMAHIRNRIEESLLSDGMSDSIAPRARVASGANSGTLPKNVSLQAQFQKLFPSLKSDESCLRALPCRFKRTIPQQGTLFICNSYVCSSYHFFALKHKLAIPYNIITAIEEIGNYELRIVFKRKKKLEKAVLIFMNESDYNEALNELSTRWKEITSVATPAIENPTTSPTLAHQSSQHTIEVDQTLRETLMSEDWELLLQDAVLKHYKCDEFVIREGEKSAQNLYQIARGKCRIQQQRPEDDSIVTIGLIGSGEVFGEISLLRKSSTTASVISDDPAGVDIYIIKGSDIARLCQTRTGFPVRFFKYLATILSIRLPLREMELLI